MERYFADEFDEILLAAERRSCSHVAVESEFIGLTHAQVGSAICPSLQAHIDVIRAVWHHHGPFANPEGQPDNSKFLAACVAVGDALANYSQVNILGARVMDESVPFDQLPEWRFLGQYQMACGLELDLDAEVAAAQEDLKAFSV